MDDEPHEKFRLRAQNAHGAVVEPSAAEPTHGDSVDEFARRLRRAPRDERQVMSASRQLAGEEPKMDFETAEARPGDGRGYENSEAWFVDRLTPDLIVD
jgi:hypothetical protein